MTYPEILERAGRDKIYLAIPFPQQSAPSGEIFDTVGMNRSLGLEPGTGWPNFKGHERDAGRVRTLAAGESWEAAVTLRMLRGEAPDVWPQPVMLAAPAGW